MHLADAFIQSDLQCIPAIHFFYQYVCVYIYIYVYTYVYDLREVGPPPNAKRQQNSLNRLCSICSIFCAALVFQILK